MEALVGRIFCVANQKGGVGKTTTAVNMAVALAKSGRQTLLVDLDPQCNATTGLGIEPSTRHPLVAGTPLRQAIVAELLPPARRAARQPDVPRRRGPDPRRRASGRPAAAVSHQRDHRLRLRADRLSAVAGPTDPDGPGQFDRSADADPVRVFRDGGPRPDDRGHPPRDRKPGPPVAVRRNRPYHVRPHARTDSRGRRRGPRVLRRYRLRHGHPARRRRERVAESWKIGDRLRPPLARGPGVRRALHGGTWKVSKERRLGRGLEALLGRVVDRSEPPAETDRPSITPRPVESVGTIPIRRQDDRPVRRVRHRRSRADAIARRVSRRWPPPAIDQSPADVSAPTPVDSPYGGSSPPWSRSTFT